MLYTARVAQHVDMTALCRALADTMLAVRDEASRPVFPPGGTRVLAYPAAHWAVADDGSAAQAAGWPPSQIDHGFVWLNLRMAAGRSASTHQRVGDALLACAKRHLEPLLAQHLVGVTLQIDESTAQVYDGKFGNLHPLFAPPAGACMPRTAP
jgi:5-carboxymethyl-2-hydroxymuconate isomerase